MIHTDRNAVICDLAETYHILDDIGLLPARQVAVLCVGLRENSRIKMKKNGLSVPLDTILLAQIIDRMNLLLWSKTKNGRKGINRPESMAEALLHPDRIRSKKMNLTAFSSPDDFWKERQRIIQKAKGE